MTTPIKPSPCTNLKLRQLTRAVTRFYDQFLAEAGLRNTQFALLSHILRLQPVRSGELARAIQMEPSTLSRNLQPLAAQGWLRVEPGADARSRMVVLTPAGAAKREEGLQAWVRAQQAVENELGSTRIAALHVLLDECLATLGGQEDPGP